MPEERLPRKLAAILYADVAGYSRLSGEDEDGTHRTLREYLDLISSSIQEHNGRVVHYAGDAVLADFGTVIDALSCATAIQQELTDRNSGVPDERKVQFRIGVNLGDVIIDADEIYGDGVNVAARLESLAEPGGVCISDAVRTAVGKKLGYHYEDMGEQEVKNIAEAVHCFRVRFPGEHLAQAGTQNSRRESTLSSTAVSPIDVSKPVQGFSGRPAIAVLPFENLSKDPEHDFFADGIAEDILTKLAMWRWLPVIARNSSFTYRGRSVDVTEVGRQLGARYLLQGSVRKAGNRVRISGQLVDAETNHHVWAQRYDRVLDDIFAVQDEITDAIVAALEPAVGRAEMQRAYRRDPQNLDAWNLYQRGMSCLVKTTREDMGLALEFFHQSSVADPEFASPLAAIAVTEFIKLTIGFNEGHTGLPPAAYEAAMRAVVLDDLDPFAHVALGYTSAFSGRQEDGIVEAERAIEINPSFALGHHCLGGSRFLNGEHDAAVEAVHVALRISPNDPWMFLFLGLLSASQYMRHDYLQSLETADLAVGRLPWYASTQRWRAVALAQLGRLDEAREVLERFLELSPNYSMEVARRSYPFRRGDDLAHYLDGLRKAGLPD